jgi:hypothetical protein
MLSRVITIVIASFITLSLPSAQAGESNDTVKTILLFEGGNLLYIYPTNGVKVAPACHNRTNGDYYTISMARPMAKQYLAALMTAQAMGYIVNFRGTGACNEQSFAETLLYFAINK